MYVYEWDEQGITSGVLSRMEVRDTYRGRKEAVLFAQPHVEPERLHEVRKLMHHMGLTVTPAEVEGTPVLKVSGFRKDDFLAQALEANGIQPLHSARVFKEKDKDAPKGFVARVKANSLKLSGLVWMVGDWSLILAGLRRRDYNEALSGIGYGSTSVVAAVWGNRKVEQLCDDMYGKLVTELSKDGYRLPYGEDATLRQFGDKGGLLNRVNQFLQNHPAQVISAVNVMGGYHVYRAGRSQNNMDKTFAGLLMMVGMLIGLLVPEKTNAEKWEEKAAADGVLSFSLPDPVPATGVKGMLNKAWNFVRERPLRIGGYLSIVNNLLMMKGAAAEWKLYSPRDAMLGAAVDGKWQEAEQLLQSRDMKKISAHERKELTRLLKQKDECKAGAMLEKHHKSKGSWHFNLVTAASYMLGNWLFSRSSSLAAADGTGKDANQPLYDMAAMFILQQPEDMRDKVLDKVTALMVEQKGLDIHPIELKQKITAQLDNVAKNPWIKAKTRTVPINRGDAVLTARKQNISSSRDEVGLSR